MPADAKGTKGDAALESADAHRTWDFHKITTNELVSRFETDKNAGLTADQAAKQHELHGDNCLKKKAKTHWFVLFIHELTGFFSLLLWFGSALCFIGYAIQEDKEDRSNLYLGVVLAGVTFVTGVFSYMQTSKSAEMMAQFDNFIPEEAVVLRDGKD